MVSAIPCVFWGLNRCNSFSHDCASHDCASLAYTERSKKIDDLPILVT